MVCKINGISKFIKINPIVGYDSQFGINGFVDLPANTLPGILGEFNNGKFISTYGTYNENSNTYFFNRVILLKFSSVLMFLNYFILFVNFLSFFFVERLHKLIYFGFILNFC
jgi:hypothetical protein